MVGFAEFEPCHTLISRPILTGNCPDVWRDFAEEEILQMVHVIAEPCVGTKDTACVEVCPVDCIKQAADESSSMLYIDPIDCIDCAACIPACPVDAIFAESDLPAKWAKYTQINAEFFTSGDAAPAAVSAQGGKPPPAKKEPEPEPLVPIELSKEEMYKPLSELRGDLSDQRKVASSESRVRNSPTFVGLVAAAVLIFVFAISNNFSKAVNSSLYARISLAATGKHKPTLIGNEFTITRKIGGMAYSAKVTDSIFGSRTLILTAPAKPFGDNLYHEDEKFFNSAVNQDSRFYYVFQDEKSDGKLDSVLKVREFWSKENRLLGRYQKSLLPTKELEAIYQNAAKTLASGLGIGKNGA